MSDHFSASPVEEQEALAEFRCAKCGKLLAKNVQGGSSFEIKCQRCGTLNSLLEKMLDQVVITDPEGVILYANRQLEDITGYHIAEVIGRRPSLWGKQMPETFYRELWRKIKTDKQSVIVRLVNRRKDGELYDALLRVSPVLDTAGEVRFFVGVETVINKK